MNKTNNKDFITIKGANENNLKNVSLVIPKNKFVIFTGLSGSGKSSLAFNTIYEEGRRRYVDSLSSYARQFLGGTKKPKVDSIEGLSPAISIEQKTTHANPRSTVGTITEIHDYLRLLFAKIGKPICPKHKIEISAQKIKDIIDLIYKIPTNSKLLICSPIAKGQKGTNKNLFEKLRQDGFLRVKIDDKIFSLDDKINIEKNKAHNISIIVDRIILNEENKSRITEAVNVALEYSKGLVDVENLDNKEIHNFSQQFACVHGDFQMPKIETKLFSFNSPYGMCEKCKGLGVIIEPDIDLIIPNKKLSINEGAIDKMPGISSKNNDSLSWQEFICLMNHYQIPLNTAIEDLSAKQINIIKYGSDDEIEYSITSKDGRKHLRKGQIEGLVTKLGRLFLETTSEEMRQWYGRFMSETLCDKCKGCRLNEYALAVKINKLNIHEFSTLSIEEEYNLISNLELTDEENEIAKMIIHELESRLGFLKNVGLEYLSLTRTAETLSGGEAQRIRLATQIGSKLTGILYVLDEPSIGLHQSDNTKLINVLKQMVEIGNTLIVVEHDEETILAADYIVDIGPLAGDKGGEVVAYGTVEDIKKNKHSITGQYLSKKLEIKVPKVRRKGNGYNIEIIGAKENNLKNINVKIPLGKFIAVTGVSGSGKSTLVNEILVKALEKQINNNAIKPGKHSKINGILNIDKIVKISQSPIGKTPRSNPATYTSVFDDIRDLYANVELARARGYEKGRFSFNIPGGRCDKCQGDGYIKIEMQFLPSVYIPCDHCDGQRYNYETLEIKYKNKSIADVLDMRISEAIEFFNNRSKIRDKLQCLIDVGLGYIKLGQSSTTLSGGEAQRIKLATHLQKKATGKTLYVLDEPTTGLHSYDIQNLLNILNRIVDGKDTVLVIEHNLDVIKSCDYIIDLGPSGGNKGGNVIATGTPEEIAKVSKSLTGQYLKDYLK
ncbi:excinuclease ABC subunit UvrA [Metamycoplasma sualvi]|uniref:excinuclease ABC subunit UvrA n=1 Tax=Metamycoplasma sualvi TaxID=2125 RepID=UPI0038737242